MNVKEELNILQAKIGTLACEVDIIHGKIDNIRELLEERRNESPLISKEQTYTEIIVKDIVAIIYDEVKEELGGEGCDTTEISRQRTIEFFEKLGLVSMKIETGRVFIYALNPCILIDNKKYWDALQAHFNTFLTKRTTGLTLACGLYKAKSDIDLGVDIYNWTAPTLKKEWKTI